MRTLHLALKKKWYHMIDIGEKHEEYRVNTVYWFKRLFRDLGNAQSGQTVYYDAVEFSLGYPRRDDKTRRMTFEIKEIDFGRGKQEWGAPDDDVFIIRLGKRL